MGNGPRRRQGGSGQNNLAAIPAHGIPNSHQPPYATHPAPHHAMPWVMPPMFHYPNPNPMGMYHPNAPFQPGAPYSDQAGYQVPNALQATMAAPTNQTSLDIPTIKQWLRHCDNHKGRSGSVQFSSLGETLEGKGFFRIDQLEGVGIDVEKIIKWTGVSPGEAVLLYRYAGEDMAQIRAGRFSMETSVPGASES
jgi:hypothetical protein